MKRCPLSAVAFLNALASAKRVSPSIITMKALLPLLDVGIAVTQSTYTISNGLTV